MKIQVLNWEIVRGRKDVNSPRWFAFEKKFFMEPSYWGKFTPKDVATYVYVCSMALSDAEGVAEIHPNHMQLALQLSLDDFTNSLRVLEELQLVRIVEGIAPAIRTEPVREVCATSIASIAEQATHPAHVHAPTAEPGSATTYEFFPENQPRKKKERKPKAELPCDVIPAFEGIREILEHRRIPTLLQEKWKKAYPAPMIFNAVRAADLWATAKGREQKNWAQFFTNWLTREFQGNRYQTTSQSAQAAPAAQEPPKRKSFWARQEEQRMAEEAAKNGGTQ